MSGFDERPVYFSDAFGSEEQTDEREVNRVSARKRFREFIREFHEGTFSYSYRDQLKRRYNLGQYYLEVDLQDLTSYDEQLADKLTKSPAEFLPLFEDAAREMADEVTKPRPLGEEEVQDIQITLKSDANPMSVRDLRSDQMAKLVKIPGIIISASAIRAKATNITIQCRSCRNTISNIPLKPGLEGYAMPLLKLQESPDAVPNGEMPRHMQLYSDRYLTEKVVPGNRVTVMGIYSIKKVAQKADKDRDGVGVGIRKPYLRVVGIQVDTEGPGRSSGIPLNPLEEEDFNRFSSRSDAYETIAKSIAPFIYGSEDVKKSIACLLFGGSRKRLPDGLTRRGDINVLLLGDPGTAKSQLLKFVEKVSPIGVYTSGKGSSAAGLTASVMRDPASRNFIMEGGAMVLADGGVVCIDEFDKMREDDRVAIHEAMEQQTISIAKAGITTTLNSRCSVLAAANSNIDFMPTILSRFDMIFITVQAQEGELSLNFIKKYIGYCRNKCGPRLSEEAAQMLKNRYVLMRSGARDYERDAEKKINIPITVRQLEAIIRISESLAKMRLLPFATAAHVEEALRLFQVSTLDAAMSGSLSGAEDFTPEQDVEEVSEQRIIQDFVKQKYNERAIHTVIYIMLRRGELEHRFQRKVLYRFD
ncbi:DNA replication licensing factor mcm5-A [Acropora cervicornis]|uniref:DNA replication licensing factor MCM5 n=1 Tax=Acropora cervicornis TaxID=6130 RepID=A0AAD9V4M5_ACRCE|nr:DNA replication licensing factor mcm5-A [Acropora cervicornis]